MIDIGYAGALLGGVLALLSPCSAMLLPGFFAYAFTSRRTLTGRTLTLYAGMLTILVPAGVAASSVGQLFDRYRSQSVAVVSVVVIVLGSVYLLNLALPIAVPGRGRTGDRTSAWAVYALGIGYGLAGGCAGPILGSVLAVAAFGHDPVYGGTLMALYALGMAVPLFVLAMLWDRFGERIRARLRPRQVRIGPVTTTVTNIVAGLLFIGVGVLLLVTDGTTAIGGVLSANAQFSLESKAETWGARISDLVVVVIVALLAVVIAAVVGRRRDGDRAVGPDREPGHTKGPVTLTERIGGDSSDRPARE